ncbi:MAG: hypothetical protein CMM61_03400 [Rhodospirillaceae bacterium]|nr:hypothetical protein [Rhodospirillaceae bacterium]
MFFRFTPTGFLRAIFAPLHGKFFRAGNAIDIWVAIFLRPAPLDLHDKAVLDQVGRGRLDAATAHVRLSGQLAVR